MNPLNDSYGLRYKLLSCALIRPDPSLRFGGDWGSESGFSQGVFSGSRRKRRQVGFERGWGRGPFWGKRWQNLGFGGRIVPLGGFKALR